MKVRRILGPGLAVALLVGAFATTGTATAASTAAGQHAGTLKFLGTSTPHAAPLGTLKYQEPEISPQARQGAGPDAKVNRSMSRPASGFARLQAPVVDPTAVVSSNPGLKKSWRGTNHFDQRYANGGNQFSLEPPDQGLCAGNGYVLETNNDVLHVYSRSGASLLGPVDLNTFYGYPAQYNRTTGDQGPFVTDPSCFYDREHNRWVHVVLTLDLDPTTGAFLGPNHLDIAVSQTGDPTGAWNLYSIPAQDDGTDGTPNHNCDLGPCFGDYPHIGADQNGFFITTNEYSLFGNQYTTAQIYAMSRDELTSGASSVSFVHLDNLYVDGTPGFTVWPATTPAGDGQYATNGGGTEYFLSSMAAEETGNTTGFDNRIGLWSLSNTSSLNSSTPALKVRSSIVTAGEYGVPPYVDQKTGSVPLAKCLNAGCIGPPPFTSVEGQMNANDSRMQQTWYANGKLWGSLDTVASVNGQDQAAIAWYEINPSGQQLLDQGYLAVAGNNVTYPAIATLANGKGIMAFTLVGTDYYPSAAYAPVDKSSGVGDVHVAATGKGPQDGFTEYWTGVNDPSTDPLRPRWGDYGAAVQDGRTILFASEYIAQTCTFQHYLADTTCGGTRSFYANWATRITRVSP